MAIHLRGSSYQASFSLAGTRYRRSFPTHDEARRWEAEVRTRVARGETVIATEKPRPARTLGELLDSTHDRWWKGAKGEKTSLINARHALEFFGAERRFDTLTSQDINRYIAALQERGYSGATINRNTAALSRLLSHARDNNWLTRTLGLPHQRESDYRFRWITPEEEQRVLVYFADRPEMRDLVVLLIDTGLRLSEALALVWADVEGSEVRVAKSKTAAGVRSVPMSARVQEMLQRMRADRGPIAPDAAVWSAVDMWNTRYYWQRMREVLGFCNDAQFRIEALRDTFGLRSIRAHTPIDQVQVQMGHKSRSSTLRYAMSQGADFWKEVEDRRWANERRAAELRAAAAPVHAVDRPACYSLRLGDVYRLLAEHGLSRNQVDGLTLCEAVQRLGGACRVEETSSSGPTGERLR